MPFILIIICRSKFQIENQGKSRTMVNCESRSSNIFYRSWLGNLPLQIRYHFAVLKSQWWVTECSPIVLPFPNFPQKLSALALGLAAYLPKVSILRERKTSRYLEYVRMEIWRVWWVFWRGKSVPSDPLGKSGLACLKGCSHGVQAYLKGTIQDAALGSVIKSFLIKCT